MFDLEQIIMTVLLTKHQYPVLNSSGSYKPWNLTRGRKSVWEDCMTSRTGTSSPGPSWTLSDRGTDLLQLDLLVQDLRSCALDHTSWWQFKAAADQTLPHELLCIFLRCDAKSGFHHPSLGWQTGSCFHSGPGKGQQWWWISHLPGKISAADCTHLSPYPRLCSVSLHWEKAFLQLK